MPDKSDYSKSSSTNPKESNGKEPSIRSKPDFVIDDGSSSQKVESSKDVDNWSHVSTIDGRGLSEKVSKKVQTPPSTATFKQTEKSEMSEASDKSDKSSKSLSVISALSSGVDESSIKLKSAHHKSDLSIEHFIDDSSETAENGSVSKPVATKKPKVEPVRKSPQKVKTPKTPIQQQSPRPIHKKEPMKAIPNCKTVTPKTQQTPKSKNIVSVKSPKTSKGKSSKPSAKPSSTSPSVSLTNSPSDGGLQQHPNSPANETQPQVLSPIVRVSRFVAQPAPPFLQSNPFIMYWNESVAGPIPSHNLLAPKSAILVCRVPNCAQGHVSLFTVNFQQYAFYILVDHQQTNEGANPQAQTSAQPQKQPQPPSSVKSSKNRKGNPKSPNSTAKAKDGSSGFDSN